MNKKNSYLIGVCGASGSGKSTFVKELVGRFATNEVALVSMDNYYIPMEEQFVDEAGYTNFDRLDSFDNEAFITDVNRLMSKEQVVINKYIYNDTTVGEIIKIDPAPIVLVEGLFVLALEELRPIMDLKLYIEAHDHKMLIRRIKRDLKHRNLDIDEVMHQWEHHVYPSFKRYIEPSKDIADLVINNNIGLNSSVDIIHEFLKTKL